MSGTHLSAVPARGQQGAVNGWLYREMSFSLVQRGHPPTGAAPCLGDDSKGCRSTLLDPPQLAGGSSTLLPSGPQFPHPDYGDREALGTVVGSRRWEMTRQFLWCGCPTRPVSSCPFSVTGGRAQTHGQAALWLDGRRRLCSHPGGPVSGGASLAQSQTTASGCLSLHAETKGPGLP